MSVVSLSDFLHRATVQFVEECTLNVFKILSPVYVGGCYLVANMVKKFSNFLRRRKSLLKQKCLGASNTYSDNSIKNTVLMPFWQF
jgi:hypothetical protein